MNVVLITKKCKAYRQRQRKCLPWRETLFLEKRCKLIQDIIFVLFMEANALHRTLKKRKSMYFLFAIWIVISAAQLLTKNINRDPVEHLWSWSISFFFFLQKCPIVNVRLGYQYTPQLVFNKNNFLPYNISI